MSTAAPIARKESCRLALVTLRALFVAASQAVVKERSRRIRRDSTRRRRPSAEEDACSVSDSQSSNGTTASPRTSSLTSASAQSDFSDTSSDVFPDHVRQWYAVGDRVKNALHGEMLSDDEGLPSTPSSFSPASTPCDPSGNESDESTVSVGRWHAIGGRLINALSHETLCEDERNVEVKNWDSVKDRFANAFRRSEVDSDDGFEQVGWTSDGNWLATVCRGCATGDEVDCSSEGHDDASDGALLLLGLTNDIVDLHPRDWYAVGTRLAVSCQNYAGWTDGKVDPTVWQSLLSTVFGGRVHSSVVTMRHELDALCRGYATMVRSFATMGKGIDMPFTKEVNVADAVILRDEEYFQG